MIVFYHRMGAYHYKNYGVSNHYESNIFFRQKQNQIYSWVANLKAIKLFTSIKKNIICVTCGIVCHSMLLMQVNGDIFTSVLNLDPFSQVQTEVQTPICVLKCLCLDLQKKLKDRFSHHQTNNFLSPDCWSSEKLLCFSNH